MKKIIIFLLALLSIAISVKSQGGTEEVFRLDADYSMHYTRPIIRFSPGTNIFVSYYEKDFHGVFVLSKQWNNTADTIELPHHYYVYDFEIFDTSVYFCGEQILPNTPNSTSEAMVGKFDFLHPYNTGGIGNFDIQTFSVSREYSRLTKMVVYEDPNNQRPIVASIGFAENNSQNSSSIHNGIDFVVYADVSTQLIGVDTLPKERYYDIVETDKYIVLVGTSLETALGDNIIGFRKFEKTAVTSSVKDDFYHTPLPHPEPMTLIVGEDINGTDNFVTATFAIVNDEYGTIFRQYDAETMTMINSQFIPSGDDKIEPYELKHIYSEDMVLLLQSSTDSSYGTRVLSVDINPQEDYTAMVDYCTQGWFYSIDRYVGNEYFAMGYSGSKPIYYIADAFNNKGCINEEGADIKIVGNYDLQPLTDQINLVAVLTSSKILSDKNISSKNIFLDCRKK